MIMKDVIISITGLQQDANGSGSVELVTQGRYGVDRERAELSYQESELTGLEGTTTSFLVLPKRVELRREGTVTSEMIFQEGEKHYCVYETPYGSTTVGLNTNMLRCALGEHGGFLDIDYNLDVDYAVVGRHRFHISIKEPEKSHSDDIRWPN